MNLLRLRFFPYSLHFTFSVLTAVVILRLVFLRVATFEAFLQNLLNRLFCYSYRISAHNPFRFTPFTFS